MMGRKAKIAALSLLAAVTLTGAVGGSIAWFNNYAIVPSEKIEGSLRGAYFAYGDGSAENPFGIRTPRHLYNLAWLQYSGYFNRDRDNDKNLDTFYFELADGMENDTLDMTGYTLPPIGTERFPFLGSFNGREKVITNLNVSNSFTGYGNNHPTTVTATNFVQMQDVGLFGVVGSLPNTELAYDASKNVIKDFGITNTVVTSASAKTLAGIVGGYVNGDISGVAVNAASVDISAASTQPVDGFTKISDHGVIGHVQKEGRTKEIKRIDESIYSINVSNVYKFNAADQGDDPGFGGSIDMKELYNRLFTIWKSCTNDTEDLGDDHNYATYPTLATQSVAKDGTKGDIVYRYDSGLANASAIGEDEDGYFSSVNEDTRAYYNTSVSDTDGKKTSSVGFVVEPSGILSEDEGYTRNVDSTTDYFSIRKVLDEGRYMCLTGERQIPIANGATLTTSYYDSITGSFIRYYDGSKYNYLHYNGSSSTPRNVTADSDDASTASLWEFTSNTIRTNTKNLSSTTYPLSDNYYYLNCSDSGVLTITSSNSTTWSKDSRGYYTTIGGSTYYLGFDGENWVTSAYYPVAVPESEFYTIYNGSNYITHVDSPSATANVTNTSSPSTNPYPLGVRWYLVSSGDTQYFSATKSTPYYYLGVNTSNYRSRYANNTSNRYSYSGTTNAGTNTGTLSYRSTGYSSSTYYPYFSNGTWYGYFYQTTLTFEKVTTPAIPAGFVTDVNSSAITLSKSITRYSDQKSTNRYNGGYPADYVNSKAATNPTYLPLKEKETRSGSSTTITPGVPDQYNTGYIVSGAKYRGDPYGDIRVSAYPLFDYSNYRYRYSAKNALGSSGFTKDTGAIGTIYTVNDNGYTETPAETDTFKASRTSLQTKVLKGSNYVYGLHFMDAKISYEPTTDATYLAQGVGQSVRAEKAVINKDTFTNYQLPTDCIDFHLKEKGYINFFAGSYYVNDDVVNTSFFSLYEIVREGSNIVQLRKISEVLSDQTGTAISPNSYVYKYDKEYAYKGSSGQYSIPYHYVNSVKKQLNGADYVEHSLTDSAASGYNTVFKTKWIEGESTKSGSITTYAAYYFEIAMNSGEYCLGSVDGKNGAYLMYLDIGANAAETNRTILSEHFSITEQTLVYPLGIAIFSNVSSITTEIQNADKEYLNLACFQIGSGYSGKITISRNATDTSQVDITRTVAENAVPNFQGDGIKLNIASELVPKESKVTDIKRLQYYDYNVNTKETTRVVITDTSVDGGAYARTIQCFDALGKEITDQEKWKIYRTKTGVKYENIATINALALDSTGDNGLYYTAGSNKALITFRYWEDDGNGGKIEYVAKMDPYIDGTSGKTGYTFEGYTFEVTVDAGSITLTVTALGDPGTLTGITLYVGTVKVDYVGQTFTYPLS